MAFVAPIVYAPQILAWTFDLRGHFTVRVKEKEDHIRFRGYCWPVVQTRWAAQTRDESLDDCFDRADRFWADIDHWKSQRESNQETLPSKLSVLEWVVRYGDTNSIDTFLTMIIRRPVHPIPTQHHHDRD